MKKIHKEQTRKPQQRAARKGPAKASGRQLRLAQPTTAQTAKHHAGSVKTKKQLCIDLLKRPNGATLDELQKFTGWQPHSVRGFLSKTARKLPSLVLKTDVGDDGVRCYQLAEEKKAPRT